MRRMWLVSAASSLLIGIVPSANAAILLFDSFDNYSDQAAFNTAWPNSPSPNVSGTLSTNQAASTPNSVNYQTSAQRNEHAFPESGTPGAANPITFNFDFFDTNGGLAPYRQNASILDGAGTSAGELLAMGLNNNMTLTADGGNYYMAAIAGYIGAPGVTGGSTAGAFFKLNAPGTPTRSTGWHNLKAVITDTQVTFFVDGFQSSTEVTSVFAGHSFDLVRLGSGVASTAQAYFDNISIDNDPVPPVPEPASMLGLGVGFFFLARRSRRQPM